MSGGDREEDDRGGRMEQLPALIARGGGRGLWILRSSAVFEVAPSPGWSFQPCPWRRCPPGIGTLRSAASDAGNLAGQHLTFN